jgi:hypothetical protein
MQTRHRQPSQSYSSDKPLLKVKVIYYRQQQQADFRDR